MHSGMSLRDMLSEVIRHNEVKADYIADTKEHIAMVPMPDFPEGVAMVLSREESNELERFKISENFHKQLAARLQIPQKYYHRLLQDHRDLLLNNVNTLFEREPQIRMVRTLDGTARAFLSRQYRRVDNEQVLEATLPVIRDEFDTTILNCNVDENQMNFKCLFNGDEHTVDMGTTRNGSQDTLHAGFSMGNNEVGGGTLFIRGFFYRSYCLNGCVFGTEETVSYRQVHVGSKLGVDNGMLLSQETMRKEDELIISAARDVLTNLASPEFTQKMGERLRRLKEGRSVVDPHASVEAVCKQLAMTETESKGVLESFIRDQDYSQWGMLNAITEQANKTESYERSTQIEELGSKIINLPINQWNQIAQLEAVAA